MQSVVPLSNSWHKIFPVVSPISFSFHPSTCTFLLKHVEQNFATLGTRLPRMIPERFSVLGFLSRNGSQITQKACHVFWELARNAFYVAFSGINSGKKWCFWVPILGLPLFAKTKCAHALLPFWNHSEIEQIRRCMFWVHSRNNNPPTKMINPRNFGRDRIAAHILCHVVDGFIPILAICG